MLNIHGIARWFLAMRFSARTARVLRKEKFMSNRNFRLVLKCVELAIELVRFADKLLALLNMANNYFRHNESKVVIQVRA